MKTLQVILLSVALTCSQVHARLFMFPLPSVAQKETTTTTTPEPQPSMDQLSKLTQAECEQRIEDEMMAPEEPWFKYPMESECLQFAMWDYLGTAPKGLWRKGWYNHFCSKIHHKYRQQQFEAAKKEMKAMYCSLKA